MSAPTTSGRAVAVHVGRRDRAPGSRRRGCPTPRPTGTRARRCAAAACRRARASPAARSRPGGTRARTRRSSPSPARCGCRRRGRRGSVTTRRHRGRRRGRSGKPGSMSWSRCRYMLRRSSPCRSIAALVELRHDLHGEAVGLGVRAARSRSGRRCPARGRRSCPRWRGSSAFSCCTSTSASTPSKALVCVVAVAPRGRHALEVARRRGGVGVVVGLRAGRHVHRAAVAGAAREHLPAQRRTSPGAGRSARTSPAPVISTSGGSAASPVRTSASTARFMFTRP